MKNESEKSKRIGCGLAKKETLQEDLCGVAEQGRTECSLGEGQEKGEIDSH